MNFDLWYVHMCSSAVTNAPFWWAMLVIGEAEHDKGQGYIGNLTTLKPKTASKTNIYHNNLRTK